MTTSTGRTDGDGQRKGNRDYSAKMRQELVNMSSVLANMRRDRVDVREALQRFH